jgi:putative MATE family efflux protein
VAAALAALAGPLVAALGADGRTAEFAETYLRIMALGVPPVLVALAGQGYLRGIGNLRTPLVLLVGGNLLNVVLELVFVYGFDWGIRGSAWGTVIAQAGMGGAFAFAVLRGAPLGPQLALARRLLALGGHIFVRTAALMAAFLLAGALVARFGDASLAAHQVAFQLWLFLALVLDALAVAGQVIVGQALGGGREEEAYAASGRLIALSVALGALLAAVMLALGDILPRAFTSDAAVLDRVAAIWPLFALMQPLNGAVFALDGILIGAGDGRYLAGAMVVSLAASAAVSGVAVALDWGLVGIWVAILVLIAVRLATLGGRFAGRRWAVTGWA